MKERIAIIRAAADLISTLADPTQEWDIALADFDFAVGQVYNGNLA